MKKKVIIVIVSILFILVIIGIIIFKFVLFGAKDYLIEKNNLNIKLPKYSFEISVNDKTIQFSSFRSKSTLKTEMDIILKKHSKYICNNMNLYYDKNNDITFENYSVKSNGLYNNVSIQYIKGKKTNDECSLITDPTKLTYKISKPPLEDICYTPSKFTYRNADGKIYNVFYECFGDLQFKTGMNKMNYLHNMILYSWISMDTVVEFLEYQVNNNSATKETYSDNSILYKNKDFSLLKCNTTEGNKDVYFGDMNFTYKNEYCK